MATDKRFVVKNGLQTENINFVFNDAVLGSSNITATMLSSNTLSFSGSTGQLFSITDSMTGVIFAVNDISGVPSIEVYDDGRVYLAETFGNVTIGNSAISSNRTSTSTTTGILQVAGGAGITGNINVGGTINLFTGSVGVGTTTPNGIANAFVVYGSAMVYGNLDLANPTGGTSGIYFNDGTYQTTAFVGAATPSFGVPGTVQVAGAANTFSGNGDSFFWDSANNRLGIGTNSPTNVLTVRSTATPAWFNTVNSAIGTNNFEIIVGNGASTGTTLGYVNNTLVPYGYLSAGSATRNLTIAANGRVGVGGVTAPQVTLDVGGSTIIGASWAGNSNFINPPANGLSVQGSVGIGTYTPLSTLDVRGTVGVTGAANFDGAVSVASLTSNGAVSGTTGTFSGDLSIADKIVHANDTDTAIRFPAADTFTIETNGSERVRVDSSGRVGIGSTAPTKALDVRVGDTMRVYSSSPGHIGITIQNTGTNGRNFRLASYADATASNSSFRIRDDGAGVDRFVINSTGDVGIGTTSPVSQLHLTTDGTLANRGLTVGQHNTGAQAALINFRKSRGTISSPTTVITNDYTGAFTFLNYDGAAYRNNAGFGARITGAVASNSVPTDIFFWAGSTDDSDPYANNTVRMVIANTGRVGIATTTPGSILDVNGIASIRSAMSVAGTAVVNALVSNNAISGTTIIGTSGTFTSVQSSGEGRFANIVSNTWIHATQNLTVASSNTSTSTATGAAVVTGGIGIGGNLNVGGTTNLFTGRVGVGTTNAATVSNTFAVFGSTNITGNVVIANPTGGVGGIYFPDGTYQTTAVTSQLMSTYEYVGNGTTTVFSTAPSTANGIANTIVFINGVYQLKDAYSWSGTNLTFVTPPPQYALISINIIGSVAAASTTSIIGVSTISANTSLLPTTPFAIVSGNTTVTLPSAATATGQMFYVKNVGTGNVVVATINNETIDGNSSLIIDSQWSTAGLLSNGANWFIF